MIQIFTRSMNDELYNKMAEFIPKSEDIQLHKWTGFNESEDCNTFLHNVLRSGVDWVITLDEDCFIFDWQAVLSLISFLKVNKYDYCGMPDGGVTRIRARSWLVINPFFAIFNAKSIRSQYTRKELIDTTEFPIWADGTKPSYISDDFNHTLISPYNGLFFWLYRKFKPFFLHARDHPDGLSTILLDHDYNQFCLHSWYSREYKNSPSQKDRIDRLYEEALLRIKINTTTCNVGM